MNRSISKAGPKSAVLWLLFSLMLAIGLAPPPMLAGRAMAESNGLLVAETGTSVTITLGQHMTSSGGDLVQTNLRWGAPMETVTVTPDEGYVLAVPIVNPEFCGVTVAFHPETGAYDVKLQSSGPPTEDVVVTFPDAYLASGPWYVGSPNSEDVVATLDDDGELRFEGTGDIVTQAYDPNDGSYWRSLACKDRVTSVEFGEGVAPKSLYSAFTRMANLKSINRIPDSVTDLRYAFAYCTSLTEAPVIPASVAKMRGAFHSCTSLTRLAPGFSFPQGANDFRDAFQTADWKPYPIVRTYCDPADYDTLSAAYPWLEQGRPLWKEGVPLPEIDTTIKTVADLKAIMQASETYMIPDDAVITLEADLDLAGSDIAGVKLYNAFDGQGHEITGVSDTLFAEVPSISNLTVRGSISQDFGDKDAGIALKAANVSNCTSYVTINGKGAAGTDGAFQNTEAAGIVYELDNDGSVNGCANYGALVDVSRSAGVVAVAGSGATVADCANYATMTTNAYYVYYGSAAGIVAEAKGDIRIERCANKAAVSSKAGYDKSRSSVAGILASPDSPTATVSIANCYNTGSIVREGGAAYPEYTASAAGIVCQPDAIDLKNGMKLAIAVSNCYNTGTIVSDKESGRGEVAPDVVLYGERDDTGTYNGSDAFTLNNCYNAEGIQALAPSNAAAALGDSFKVCTEGTNAGNTPLLKWEFDGVELATVTFAVEPADATVRVTGGGEVVEAQSDGSYSLVVGREYAYAVSAAGHFGKTGTFTARKGLTVKVALEDSSGYEGSLVGGETVAQDGRYRLLSGATGSITIGDSCDVEFVGDGVDAAGKLSNLHFVVGEGTALTLSNVYISNAEDGSVIDFAGSGSLNVEGANVIDLDYGNNYYAAIHVGGGKGHTVTFGGTGVLYGYKSSCGAYIGAHSTASGASDIGPTTADPMGNVVFKSGTWMIKGTKVGAVIGNDTATGNLGTITIDGGQLYLKTVSQGAAIGASKQGNAPVVVVNGGIVQILTDFSGSAVGHGGDAKGAGTLAVNGGSLQTIITPNAYNRYGYQGKPKTDGSFATDACVTAETDAAMLRFPTEEYADQETVAIEVDGKLVYEGAPRYAWIANEKKNPGASLDPQTPSNWLTNDVANKVPAGDPYDDLEPAADGSQLAGESALYLWLPKGADHAVVANGEARYKAVWSADAKSFSLEKEEEGPAADDPGKVDPQPAAPVDIARAKVVLAKASCAYNGKMQAGSVQSVTLDGAVLRSGVDYTVTAVSGKTVGSYEVVVTGKGAYCGTATATFEVVPAANPTKVKTAAKRVRLAKARKGSVSVKGAVTVKGKPTGSSVRYARVAKGSSKALPKVNAKTGAITVKKGAKKGTYKVKVKVTVSNANYKTLTKTVTAKVKVK